MNLYQFQKLTYTCLAKLKRYENTLSMITHNEHKGLLTDKEAHQFREDAANELQRFIDLTYGKE